MTNSESSQRKLRELLNRLGPPPAPPLPDTDDPIVTLVTSLLIWEATTPKALAAYKRLREKVVDFNDLRVCLPFETQEFLGPRYPHVADRCQRMRAVLRNIYRREHAVNLDRLQGLAKRDVKRYLDSLEGMVPYVSCRLMLLCFNAHRMPVDEQLRTALIEHGAASGSMDVPGVSAWLGRQIKAAKGVETHFALQSWIDEGATRIELGTGASSRLLSGSNASKTAGKKGASERAGAGTINKAAR